MAVPQSDAWLTHLAPRMQQAGFVALPPQTYQPYGFKFALRRTRFEITKFGMTETFFVFADTPNLAPQTIQSLSTAAFNFAKVAKTIPLPCGFFESVWAFAVAITNGLHPQVAEYVRQTEPAKHWSAGEIPVVFDTATGQLVYFERTPMWGAAYYAGFRRQIRECLG